MYRPDRFITGVLWMSKSLVLHDIFFNDTATTEIYTYLHTLSLHDALPISDAVLAASIFHYGEYTIREAKDYLHAHGIEVRLRSEEHTSELQSLMRISYAVFCLKKKI